ncbi:hypothetical protein B5G03_14220 [Gemmiger sp. An50]|nr:hypothetical protein B5G03_14220 [Gemmiger sp. An50]
MRTYTDARRILESMGYPEFLPLQEKAFRDPALYDPEKNIFITGDTSSGKTLIPLIHYLLEKEKNPDYKMLFLVPYRALASQKQSEIQELLHRVQPKLHVALSTGEYREEDDNIRAGEVDMAVIIYEKAYYFACNTDGFLQHYQTLVYDEFALSEDDTRGVNCDLMLLRGQREKCRLFALSTPHYNWDRYICNNDFTAIQVTEQSSGVPREEIPIFLDAASNSGQICAFHDYNGKPIVLEGVREQGSKDDLIEDLCVRHLAQGHRILVFMNNCAEVRNLSRKLAHRLRKNHPELLNPVDTDRTVCFQRVLDETGVLEEDLLDLMDPDECLSFAQGICYHNSWLGYTLRSMVEREILTDEGNLKVVFCTETMAYGINSSVDVVIVADMHKSLRSRDYIPEKGEDNRMRIHGDGHQVNRFLTLNEYQNYIGRAGRYGRTDRGYAYALMIQKPEKNSIRERWSHLMRMREQPLTATSTLLKLDPYCNRKNGCSYFPDNCPKCSLQANEFAMPVMSLITTEGVTYRQIKNQLKRLPGLTRDGAWLDRNINTALKRLIWSTRPTPSDYGWVRFEKDELNDEVTYHLTKSGQCMSGFMVTMYEANVMMQYLMGRRNSMPERRSYTPQALKQLIERDPFDLFFQLCYLPELQKIAFDFFEINDVGNEAGSHRRDLYQELCTKQLRSYRKKAISNELYRQLIYPATNTYNYTLGLPTLYRTLLSILIYEWYKNASVGQLNDELNAGSGIFTITPGRISRLSQQVSFYLQVTQALCRTLSDEAYEDIAQLLNRMELCLYFGIRENDAWKIDVLQLRRLTRQQQLMVSQILDFCANHPAFTSPEQLTRRERGDWKRIVRMLRSISEDSEIPQTLRKIYPILNTAKDLLYKE